jgi:hypothetical protein
MPARILKIRIRSFTNVTNEERNDVVRFMKDPTNLDLAITSKNFHCVVLSLFFRRDKKGRLHRKHKGKI